MNNYDLINEIAFHYIEIEIKNILDDREPGEFWQSLNIDFGKLEEIKRHLKRHKEPRICESCGNSIGRQLIYQHRGVCYGCYKSGNFKTEDVNIIAHYEYYFKRFGANWPDEKFLNSAVTVMI